MREHFPCLNVLYMGRRFRINDLAHIVSLQIVLRALPVNMEAS